MYKDISVQFAGNCYIDNALLITEQFHNTHIRTGLNSNKYYPKTHPEGGGGGNIPDNNGAQDQSSNTKPPDDEAGILNTLP